MDKCSNPKRPFLVNTLSIILIFFLFFICSVSFAGDRDSGNAEGALRLAANDKANNEKNLKVTSDDKTTFVECAVQKSESRQGKSVYVEIGRLNLYLHEDHVSGDFTAEYEMEGGRKTVKGVFNGEYGYLVSNLDGSDEKVIPWPDGSKNEFHGKGTYQTTFRPTPPKDGGEQTETQTYESDFKIGGSLHDGIWSGLIPARMPPVHLKHMGFHGPFTALNKISQLKPEKPAEQKKEKEECNLEDELRVLRDKTADAISLQLMSRTNMTEIAAKQKEVETLRGQLEELNKVPQMVSQFSGGSMRGMGYMYDGLRAAARDMRAKHAQLCREQDQIISTIENSYVAAIADLESLTGQLRCPDVKKALQSLKMGLEESRELDYLKCYFVSGQRKKFQAIAEQYLRQPKFEHQALWLLGMDYLSHGEMSSGLYALRKAREALERELAKHEKEKIPEDLSKQREIIETAIQNTEVRFLSAVDRKVLGEAAMVRKVLWSELERGEPTFWNLITGGVSTWLAGFGRSDYLNLGLMKEHQESGVQARADDVGTILMNSAQQHVGLVVIMRFRQKGLTLDEIKALNNEKIIAFVRDNFKGAGLSSEEEKKAQGHVLSAERAKKVRAWIYQGFQNPDVIRLARKTKEEFDLFTGRSYYNAEEFEQTWYEMAGDFLLNPLMIATIFAPYAKLTSESGKFLTVKLMTSAEAAASKNFVQTMATIFRVPEIIQRINASNSMVAQRVQSVLKFNAEASLLKKIFAENMVQMGSVQLASMVGGLPAQVMAEILTTLGAGDLDQAASILQNSGVSRNAARQLANSLKDILEKTSQLRLQAEVVSNQNLIKNILKKLDMGEAIDATVASALEKSAKKLEDILKEIGETGGSDLMRMQIAQVDLTARGLRAVAKGDVATARHLSKVLDDADEFITRVAKKVEDGIKVADRAAGDAGDVIRRGALREVTEEELGNRITTADRECAKITELWEHQDKAFKEALQEGNYDAAIDHHKAKMISLNTKLEQAVASGNSNAVKDSLDELTLYLESYTIARDVKNAARHIKPYGNAEEIAKDAAMKFIEPDEVGKVSKQITELFEEVRMGKQQLDDILPPLKTSAGEATLEQPRKIKIGDEWYVFKETKNARDEVFASRLAKKLEINSPACAEISWIDAEGIERHGVMQRLVPDVSDLSAVDRGTILAVKRHVAEDRVFSFLVGDPDRHGRNFLITGSGKVYSIDHGQSAIVESFLVDWSKPWPDIEQGIIADLKRRYQLYMSKVKNQWPIIRAVDTQITYKDMEGIIGRIERLTQDDLAQLLKLQNLFHPDSDEYKNALRMLMTRKKAIVELFKNPDRLLGLKREKQTLYTKLPDAWQQLPEYHWQAIGCAA
jgi:hypothetical protein